MSSPNHFPQRLEFLAGYYGILQVSHLTLISRAGWILVSTGKMIFPALPPADGWSPQVLPFLVGMGVLDAIAAGLGIYCVFSLFTRKHVDIRYWMTSLGIALTSAMIFTIGTINSGSWQEHPTAYGLLGVFFFPLFPLFINLFRYTGGKDDI